MSFSELDSPIILAETYTHQLMTQALTPLSILHSTLPLFKPSLTLGSPGSSRFSRTGGSIILCVPAVARVGVLGSSSTSMAAASVMHGFDVLRRESKLAADKGSGNAIEGANVRFITVDVGEISGGDIDGGEGTRTVRWERRKPSDVSAFSQRLMDIVDGSRRPWSAAWIWQLVLGSHRSIGAGGKLPLAYGFKFITVLSHSLSCLAATTYSLAARLPTSILDFLLLLPPTTRAPTGIPSSSTR